MKRQPLLIACTVAALAAAGCAGGGGSTMTPTSPGHAQSTTSKATVTIKIPPKTSSSSASSRSPQYVSVATNSATFTFTGMAAQVVNLSSGGGNCTAVTGGLSCTAVINAQVGTNETVAIKTFVSTDGTGAALTVNTETGVNIVASSNPTDNALTYTLNGVVASLALTLDPTSVTAGTAATVNATYSALDPAGDTIIGDPVDSSGNAVTLAPTLTSDATSGITIPSSPTGETWAVQYDGSAITSPVTFTVADSGTGYTVATPLTVNGAPTPPPGISNGDFGSGALLNSSGFGWNSCSFAHATLAAPVNASPAPKSVSAQTTATVAIVPPSTVTVGALPANENPNHTGDTPPTTTNAALVGDVANETAGASGVCQTFLVPTDGSATQLTFWAYELGGEYNFKYADQEAAILDSTGTTIDQQLFAETNCFQDPTVFTTQTPAATSGCWPASLGGDTNGYNDWQGGYWVQRGPYDLSAYVGDTITLFIGVWSDQANATGKYGNAIYVTDVELLPSASGGVTVNGRNHR